MQTVPVEFTEGTYRYTQRQRVGMVGMYCQEHLQSGTQRFEVVRLRVLPPHVWPNGYESPEREGYPSARAWGTDGWTFLTMPEAQQQFDALLNLYADIGNPDDIDDIPTCTADTELRSSMLNGGQ